MFCVAQSVAILEFNAAIRDYTLTVAKKKPDIKIGAIVVTSHFTQV